MSFLKIQTPSNQIINIDLATTETDFIKLLACLSNIEQEKIKGLRDKFGNYFTLYSALYNPQGNFNYSNVYYMVCSNDNTNRNLNYPILDRFENFPDNEIPISFSHDSNNYFKRKNIHNLSNDTSHSQIRHNLLDNQINLNHYQHIYQDENQLTPSPYSNKNITNSCYSINKFFPNNKFNDAGNLDNPDQLSRGINTNFSNDTTRFQSLILRQLHQNPPNNYENFSRSTNKQNIGRNVLPKNISSNYSIQNDYLEKIDKNNEFLSLDNRFRAKNKIPNRSHYTQNNFNRNIANIKSNLDINRDFSEHDLDHLKRNLVPEKNLEYNNYLNSRGADKYSHHENPELFLNQNEFYQLSKGIKFNPEINLQQSSSSNNIYANSNNLRILKERKLNESYKLKDNSSNIISKDLKQLQIEKYLSIANDLGEINLIDNKFLPKLKQLILNENEDIITIFKFFCQDVIEIETLVNGVNKILSWTIDKTRRPESPDLLFNKNQLVKLIDSLNDSIFDDPADHILLRNLANYQNDFILAAYELYLSDHDIENFIDSVKRFINKYNKPVVNNANFYKEKTSSDAVYNPEKISKINVFKNDPTPNELKSSNQIDHFKNNYNPSDFKLRENFNQRDLENDIAIRDDKFYKDNVGNKSNPNNLHNNKIHTSIHSSNQSKTVSNLNLNGNGVDHARNSNNQFNSFIKPQEKIISIFTTSNHTLNNKTSEISKENNPNNNNNFELNTKEEKDQNANYNSNNNPNANSDSNNKINASISSFENLLKFLHTEQRIIFKYAIKNKLPEVNVFAQLYSTIESEDILLRTVKQFCKQFISEKITKNLNEEQDNFFKNFMQKRDQNLLGFFKEFNKHNSIEKLQLDILEYLNNNIAITQEKSGATKKGAFKKDNINNNDHFESREKRKEKDINEANKFNQKQEKPNEKLNDKKPKDKQKEEEKYIREKSFSSSEYEENLENIEDSKFMKKDTHKYKRASSKMQESDNENNEYPNSPYNNDENSSGNLNKNYKLHDFLKLINNFNFISSQQKQLIENLINENNQDILEVLESYHKTKNILNMKSSIKTLLKRYKKSRDSRNSPTDDLEKRNVKRNSENSNNRGGDILSKLEKIKKQNTKNESKSRKYSNQVDQNVNQNREVNDSEEDTNGPNKKKRVNYNRESQNNNRNSEAINNRVPKIPLNSSSNKIIINFNNYSLIGGNKKEKEDQENSDESYDSFQDNLKDKEKNQMQKQISIENKSYESLDELLQDLQENQKISSHQHKYIIQRFKNKDEILLSAWEVYSYNKHLPDLIESLRIFSTNVRRQSYVATMSKTPVALAKSKNDIIDFLKSKDNNREKEEIKKKQLNIIEILVNENMLDRKTAPIINQMIYEENHFLISAFEIFSVSKDHWEFVETLGMITDIYCSDVKKMSKSSTSLDKIASVENKDSRLAILFENFIKNNKFFKDNEIDIFRKKLFTKDDFFMSALEFYENNLDQEEFVENLQQVLK